MIINHNISALNTLNKFNKNNKNTASAMGKLSSGLRINKASDDSAGLAISEKMRAQIRGLQQAQRNTQDGISLIQTAESGLETIQNPNLLRLRELAVQSANDTLTDEDRQQIQKEVSQLKKGINKIANNTEFNGIKLLNQYEFNKITEQVIGQIPGQMTWTKSSNGYMMLDNTTNGSTFVAVGRDGRIASSTDGVIWNYISNSNTITSEVLTGVTSGAGMFVAVGNKATILTSNDGVNWMQQASGMNPSTHDFDEIIYDGTKFIAVTRNTLDIVTSTDGVNWNKESGAVGSITYGNGKYLSGSDEIRTSNDGVNWTTSTPLSSLGVTSGITNMLWTGDKYVVLTKKNDVLMSDDGVNWNKNTITDDNQVDLYEIAWNGSQYLAVGSEPIAGGNIGHAYTSLDGIEWFESTIPSGSTGLYSTLSENGKFHITGNNVICTGTPSLPITNTIKTNSIIIENDNKNINLQIGANSGDVFSVKLTDARTTALGIDDIDLSTRQGAESAISKIDQAIKTVSTERGKFGAYQNRLEHSLNNASNYEMNLNASESRIRDADIAKQTMEMTKNQILSQASQAMLSQANQKPQQVMQLISGNNFMHRVQKQF